MPRKAAATTDSAGEPRRSARIKDQPKPEPAPKKAPAKPRSKKPKADVAEDAADKAPKEDKPKSARGKKRTADEAKAEDAVLENGAPADEDAPPPAKRVRVL